jgi:hypothetical protein
MPTFAWIFGAVAGVGGLAFTIFRHVTERKDRADEQRVKLRVEVSVTNVPVPGDEYWSTIPWCDLAAGRRTTVVDAFRVDVVATGERKVNEGELRCRYFDLLESGGPVSPVTGWLGSPFAWGFPILDIKFHNYGRELVYLNTLALRAIDSKPIEFPVPVIQFGFGGSARRFVIANDGSAPLLDARIRFDLLPFDEGTTEETLEALASLFPNDADRQYEFAVGVGNVKAFAAVDVSDALHKAVPGLHELDDWFDYAIPSRERVDLRKRDDTHFQVPRGEWEARTQQLCAPFSSGVALLVGELSYSGFPVTRSTDTPPRAERRYAVKFWTTVDMYGNGEWGGGIAANYTATTTLEVDRSNYEVTEPISFAIEPGAADRLHLVVGCERSAGHSFDLQLVGLGGFSHDIGRISVPAFVPTGHEPYVR